LRGRDEAGPGCDKRGPPQDDLERQAQAHQSIIGCLHYSYKFSYSSIIHSAQCSLSFAAEPDTRPRHSLILNHMDLDLVQRVKGNTHEAKKQTTGLSDATFDTPTLEPGPIFSFFVPRCRKILKGVNLSARSIVSCDAIISFIRPHHLCNSFRSLAHRFHPIAFTPSLSPHHVHLETHYSFHHRLVRDW